jgi:hypothetical protein
LALLAACPWTFDLPLINFRVRIVSSLFIDGSYLCL